MNHNCYVIGEIGLNHNGNINIAKDLIDVAAIAGANAVKLQKRTVDILATNDVLDSPDHRFPEFGNTYRAIRESLEFGYDEYVELKMHAKNKGLDFIATAFDCEAVDFLIKVGVDSLKLASHSLTNVRLLKYIAGFNKKVILSTGMCTLEEIDIAVKILKDGGCNFSLLHCVSSYPTPNEDCNLKVMQLLRERYCCEVGYSGHEIGDFPTILAVASGANIIERHFTLDSKMPGFDHKISLEPDSFISMVRKIRLIPQIFGHGEKTLLEVEKVTRAKYHVSAVLCVPANIGDTLTEDMVIFKNPGTGIPYKDLSKVLGKKFSRFVDADKLIQFDMFE